jgi:Arc/MetJ-type ribon-helix-helix transcriptional regulator
VPSVEVSLPDDVDMEISQLVEEGEFINRDQAVEELLSLGVSAYSTESTTEPVEEDLFTQVVEDQQDPAMRNEAEDDEHTL